MGRIVNIALAVAILLFTACGDKGVLSTNYEITPLLQLEKDGNVTSAVNVKGYAYYVDTADWKVVSWQDALQGRITAKSGEETRGPDFTAVPGADGRLVLGPIMQETFMVLVCYTEPGDADGGEMYAWRKAGTLENMPVIDVKVTFKPWQTKGRYTDAKWVMINDNPPEPEPAPEPL